MSRDRGKTGPTSADAVVEPEHVQIEEVDGPCGHASDNLSHLRRAGVQKSTQEDVRSHQPRQGSGASASTVPSVITGHIDWNESRQSEASKMKHAVTEKANIILGNVLFKRCINGVILASAVELGLASGEQNAHYDRIFLVFENCFTAVFFGEVLLKLWMLRANYFSDPNMGHWNIVDFLVTMISVIDLWVLVWFPEDGAYIDVVRIFRVARVLRLTKLARTIPEVRVVVEGLFASLRAMVWILLLLLIVIYIFGLIFVEIVGQQEDLYPAHNTDMGLQVSDYVDNFNSYFYFGTIFRAMVTLWGVILLAEWEGIARPIYEVQPFMFVLVSVLVCVATLGIFNVIIGVIVERTTQAIWNAREGTQDDIRKRRAAVAHNLADAMFEIDVDGNDQISKEELMNAGSNEILVSMLADINFPQGFTLANLHTMLDLAGNGVLSKNEFVVGLMRLVHSDSFSSVCLTQFTIGQLKLQVSGLHEEMHHLAEGRRGDQALLQDILTELRLSHSRAAEVFSDRASVDDEAQVCSPRSVGNEIDIPIEQFLGSHSALSSAVLRLESPLVRLVELAREEQVPQAQGQEEVEPKVQSKDRSQNLARCRLLDELEKPAMAESTPPADDDVASAPSLEASGEIVSSPSACSWNMTADIPMERRKAPTHGMPSGLRTMTSPNEPTASGQAWPREIAALIRSVNRSPATSTTSMAVASMQGCADDHGGSGC